MNNKYGVAILILALLVPGISCSKSHIDTHKAEEDAQKDNPPAEIQKGRNARISLPGKGLGRRAQGQGRGLGFGRCEYVKFSSDEENSIEIATTTTEYKSLKSSLKAMGKVLAHPQRKAIVSYAFPARVAQIHVRIGDWVNQGERLVTLQSEEVGTAKSEFYKAQADYELARVNHERIKRLVDRGAGAKKDLLSAEAELKVAEATLDSSEKKLHVLGFTEAQVKEISESHLINPVITLFAPLNGKIIENNAILGAMINQATEILVVMDPNVLCIDAEIYEKDIAKIRNDQKVKVSVPAYPGETFSGNISYISDVLHEETRTITVRTQVENTGLKLKPGMFANINIFLNHQTKALVIPERAVLDEKSEKIVFVKKDGEYFLQVVETGIKENGYIEILQGLNEGDEVVTTGNYQLKSKYYEEILKKGHVH